MRYQVVSRRRRSKSTVAFPYNGAAAAIIAIAITLLLPCQPTRKLFQPFTRSREEPRVPVRQPHVYPSGNLIGTAVYGSNCAC